MSCSRDDIVLLPIPFTDLSSRKVRPAIVIGFGTFPGDLFVVPISSQPGNVDFPLTDWRSAGLNVPCGVKSQIATVEAGAESHRPHFPCRSRDPRCPFAPLAAFVTQRDRSSDCFHCRRRRLPSAPATAAAR
jgi:mRNA interferase MazF